MIGGLILLLAAHALAGFEDTGYNARALSMGGAFTAVGDDLASLYYNPGASGQMRHSQAQTGYMRQGRIPSGPSDEDQMSLAAGFPVDQELIRGTVGLQWQYRSRDAVSTERLVGLGFGTRGFQEWDQNGLELGGTLKFLSQSARGTASGLKPALDFGVLGRFGERTTVGASLLNLNGPGLGGGDRAPASIRLGVAERVRGFTVALDVAKREPSGGFRGASSMGAGLERWWATPRHGSFAARTGLLLGDRSKLWSWGTGWSILGGDIAYAMTLPLTGTAKTGHAVTLTFRFGASNPEQEYERVLSEEMRYRKDLTQALEAGEVKQWKLGEELRKLREEIDALRQELADKTFAEASARARLKSLEDKHKKALDGYKKIEDERKGLAAKTKETLFKEDWSAYQKLKSGGAPDAVLAEQVRRILKEYKDAGVDLSEPNQELLRLVRAGRN